MLRTLAAAGALALAFTLVLAVVVAPALAAEATTVTLPYGDWIAGLAGLAAQVLAPVLIAAATGLVAVLPWPLRLFLTASLVERLARNALDFALNEVEGAARGRALTVDLGRAVLARAVGRAVAQAPGWLLEAAGGPVGIAEKVFRLLHLEPAASAANTLAPVLAARDGRG
jgi:hypothetical protein